jgi:hypothetical protein
MSGESETIVGLNATQESAESSPPCSHSLRKNCAFRVVNRRTTPEARSTLVVVSKTVPPLVDFSMAPTHG